MPTPLILVNAAPDIAIENGFLICTFEYERRAYTLHIAELFCRSVLAEIEAWRSEQLRNPNVIDIARAEVNSA